MAYKKYNEEGTDWEYSISPVAKLLITAASVLFGVIILLWVVAIAIGSGTLGGIGGVLLIPLVALAIWAGVKSWVDLDCP